MPSITPAMVARGRTIAEPRPSPDGTRLAFAARLGGAAHLVVTGVDAGPERLYALDPPPALPHGSGGGAFDWALGGDALAYAAADGTIRLVDLATGAVRTVVDRGPAWSPTVHPDGRLLACTVDGRDVAVVDLARPRAWPERRGGADFVLDPAWAPDGRLAWHEWDDPHMAWDESRIVVDGVVVASGGVAQPRFAPDGRLGWLDDRRGWSNVWVDGEPVVDEPAEHGTPAWGPGIRTWTWSPDGARIAFVRNERGFGRLCTVDVATRAVTDVATGWHASLHWSPAGICALRSGARTPTAVVVYPGVGQRRTLAVGPSAGFPDAALVEPEVVSWQGDDGGPVHGRLYAPPGADRPPLLVWIHGGPTDQTRVEWQPLFPYFVERGWAVLAVDHRGSTGWGRDYRRAMDGRWGDLDVADAAAGIRWAVDAGRADPRRVVPIGGSAGGFTVLNLLARHGGLCAAGVARYPVSDLLDLDEHTHRLERHYNAVLVGPLPEAADEYRARSPITVAGRIGAPVLLLHGSDDEVVPVEQTRRLAAAVPSAELHVYEGERHGWRRADTVEDELGRIEDFLRRHVLRWRA